jgi:hypothetical protein
MISRSQLWQHSGWSLALYQLPYGEEKELLSSILKVENMIPALPPDTLPPVAHGVQEERVLEEAIVEQLLDDNEEEDLPNQLLDSDKA